MVARYVNALKGAKVCAQHQKAYAYFVGTPHIVFHTKWHQPTPEPRWLVTPPPRAPRPPLARFSGCGLGSAFSLLLWRCCAVGMQGKLRGRIVVSRLPRVYKRTKWYRNSHTLYSNLQTASLVFNSMSDKYTLVTRVVWLETRILY